MSEQPTIEPTTPEQPEQPEQPETPPAPPEPAPEPEDTLTPAPEDAPDDVATGYAVYDRTLARYVGPVTSKRPSKGDAAKLVGKGHTAAVVRV